MKIRNSEPGLSVRTYSETNNRIINGLNKPDEDYFISDEDNKIFIVADGITRPHSEYAGDGMSRLMT